ncbi:MAG: hypothetical protein IIB00_02280 [candidate division Zixibacteria bacterium]|nr:hypothetical protein [candidate division Zixibacteria bacterium]
MKPTKPSETTLSVYDDEESLIQALSTFLLSEYKGEMETLVNKLVVAFHGRSIQRQIILLGDSGFFADLIKELLQSWGIEVVEDTDLLTPPSIDALDIPTFHKRRYELPAIISFFMNEHLRRIRSTGRELASIPTTISGWLLLFMIKYPLWNGFNDIQQFCKKTIDRAYGKTIEFRKAIEWSPTLLSGLLKQPNLLYWISEESKLVVEEPFEIDKFYGKQKTDLVTEAYRLLQIDENPLVSLYLLRYDSSQMSEQEHYFPLKAIKQVIDNIEFLGNLDISKLNDMDKSRFEKCLILRSEGESEKEIAKILGFRKPETYQSWVKKKHINMIFQDTDTVFEHWRKARDDLGIFAIRANSKFTIFLFNELTIKPNTRQTETFAYINSKKDKGALLEKILDVLSEKYDKSYGCLFDVFKNSQKSKLLMQAIVYNPSLQKYFLNPNLVIDDSLTHH